MKKYVPSGYQLLNLEDYPLDLGDSEDITDSEIVEQAKNGLKKPVLCTWIVDETLCSAWLGRFGTNALYGTCFGDYIKITIYNDKITIVSDEL